MNNRKLPDRYSDLRNEKGLSQTELANKLNCNKQLISKLESGERSLSMAMLKKYADYFHVSTDYLLGLQSEPTNEPDVIAVTEYTGLSEEAIDTIKASIDFGNKHIVERIINSGFFINLVLACRSIEGLSEEIQEIITGDEYKKFLNEYKFINKILKSKDEKDAIKISKLIFADYSPMCYERKEQIDLERYKAIKYIEKLMDIFDCRANKEESDNGSHNPKKE